MKIQLIHRQVKSSKPYCEFENLLTHIKLLDDDGRFIKFAKITPDLLNLIRESIITLGDTEKILCPQCSIEMLESTSTVFGVDYFIRQCPKCHRTDKHEIK